MLMENLRLDSNLDATSVAVKSPSGMRRRPRPHSPLVELNDRGRDDKMETVISDQSRHVNYYQAMLLMICAGEVWVRGCGRGLPSASTTDRPGC
ncbi:hypothetical protein Pcinc_037044 [Petrolisthes cinctipes]|uniref:Uncharacterized protein n=1 Tax=Petrolisthes cinctipes TaxID=88211 RepID=A0AAE1ELD4_PETCI|nr:hypothetical protein Pcinc_037044 [Petrolisthes cinctipes]